jgi:hypothetical protein
MQMNKVPIISGYVVSLSGRGVEVSATSATLNFAVTIDKHLYADIYPLADE